MNVYRRPRRSSSRRANTLVARISAEALRHSISMGSKLEFPIDKRGRERIPMGAIQFENSDLFALLEGALNRLNRNQNKSQKTLKDIEAILNRKTLDEGKRLAEIQWAILEHGIKLEG